MKITVKNGIREDTRCGSAALVSSLCTFYTSCFSGHFWPEPAPRCSSMLPVVAECCLMHAACSAGAATVTAALPAGALLVSSCCC